MKFRSKLKLCTLVVLVIFQLAGGAEESHAYYGSPTKIFLFGVPVVSFATAGVTVAAHYGSYSDKDRGYYFPSYLGAVIGGYSSALVIWAMQPLIKDTDTKTDRNVTVITFAIMNVAGAIIGYHISRPDSSSANSAGSSARASRSFYFRTGQMIF